jgi:hypothetical protein
MSSRNGFFFCIQERNAYTSSILCFSDTLGSNLSLNKYPISNILSLDFKYEKKYFFKCVVVNDYASDLSMLDLLDTSKILPYSLHRPVCNDFQRHNIIRAINLYWFDKFATILYTGYINDQKNTFDLVDKAIDLIFSKQFTKMYKHIKPVFAHVSRSVLSHFVYEILFPNSPSYYTDQCYCLNSFYPSNASDKSFSFSYSHNTIFNFYKNILNVFPAFESYTESNFSYYTCILLVFLTIFKLLKSTSARAQELFPISLHTFERTFWSGPYNYPAGHVECFLTYLDRIDRL